MEAVGIILAGGKNYRMKDLSTKRAIAAMPVAGNYRCIDFALSSFTNSRIAKVAVLAQYNARSLNEHLNSSKWWNFGRKHGGLYVFNPTTTADNVSWYRGTADALYQNIDFLKKSHEPYVVIAGGDGVYSVDFSKVLKFHIEKNADITVVVKDFPEGADVSRYGVVRMDEDQRIIEFEEKPMITNSRQVSTGIYIMRRRKLIEALEKCDEEERYDFVNDIIIRHKNSKRIFGYKLREYWGSISSVEDYFNINMAFLRPEVRDYFFKNGKGLYTKVDDCPPAKYNVGSDVSNSIVAGGCIINGKVENSVLFPSVYVGNNCIIKNSIILNGVYIDNNTHIENCIVESRSMLKANAFYSGDEGIKVINIE